MVDRRRRLAHTAPYCDPPQRERRELEVEGEDFEEYVKIFFGKVFWLECPGVL